MTHNVELLICQSVMWQRLCPPRTIPPVEMMQQAAVVGGMKGHRSQRMELSGWRPHRGNIDDEANEM